MLKNAAQKANQELQNFSFNHLQQTSKNQGPGLHGAVVSCIIAGVMLQSVSFPTRAFSVYLHPSKHQ